MNLFQLGDFTLSRGTKSWFKIDCDALTDDDINCLAVMVTTVGGPFHSVEGIPRGGLRLAAALERYKVREKPLHECNIHLIVDDVLTTGASMRRAREVYYMRRKRDDSTQVRGIVLFARDLCPYWVWPLFSLNSGFWSSLKEE